MEQENYYINWIRNKIDKNSMFINYTTMEESDLIDKELNALMSSDVNELNSFVEKYLTEQQIKTMKAAYRKKVTRKRAADTIELSYEHSDRLADLAEYTKSNKRKYIKNIIDTNYQEMLDKKIEVRKSAYKKISLILDGNIQIHHKMLDVFPFNYLRDLHMLIWLKTENKKLENYAPEEFLRKKNGLEKVLAALDCIKEEDYDETKIDWINL